MQAATFHSLYEAHGRDVFRFARFLTAGLLLGYSGIREPDLRLGVSRLAAVLRKCLAGPGVGG